MNDIRKMISSAKTEDLRQLRDFVSLCVQLEPKDFQIMLTMLNDAILDRMTD